MSIANLLSTGLKPWANLNVNSIISTSGIVSNIIWSADANAPNVAGSVSYDIIGNMVILNISPMAVMTANVSSTANVGFVLPNVIKPLAQAKVLSTINTTINGTVATNTAVTINATTGRIQFTCVLANTQSATVQPSTVIYTLS